MKTTFLTLTGGYLLPLFKSITQRLSVEECLIKAEREEDPGMYDDGEFIRVSDEYVGETLTVISDEFGEIKAVFNNDGNEVEFEKTRPLSSEKWQAFQEEDPFLPESLRMKGMRTHSNIFLSGFRNKSS